MCNMSMGRLGGLALIIGPALAFVMFLLQPGGIIIDTAEPSDPIAAIEALTNNPTMANITVPLVVLGIMIMAFGLYSLQVSTRSTGIGDAATRMGLAFIIVGLLSWIWGQGVALAITIGLEDETVHFLTPLFVARVAMTLLGGMLVSLGFLTFALSMPAAGNVEAWVNRLVGILSVVSLASFYWAAAEGGDLDQGLQLARSLYVIWVIWLAYQGVRLMKQDNASGS